jgi:hypothetical protein
MSIYHLAHHYLAAQSAGFTGLAEAIRVLILNEWKGGGK